MRVTQNMLSNNMLKNISSSYQKLNTYMEQLSSGKKITRPSQDPVVAMKGMNYRSQSTSIEQYKRNTNEVHHWFDNSDAALDKATQAMQKIRELTLEASNDSNGESERKSIKKEVKQLKEHLVDIANTKINGKYIFNGSDTKQKPIEKTGNDDGEEKLTFHNNTSPVEIEVADGIKLKANVDTGEIFGEDLFDDIGELISSLEANDSSKIEDQLGGIDDHIEDIIDGRADLGARMNRLELIENRLGDQDIAVKKMMANNENVDYEEAITQLITQESMHRAALAAGSRIIQPSLVDFLR